MNLNELKNGDILDKGKAINFFIGKENNRFKFFVLNGFYAYDTDENGDNIRYFDDSDHSETPKNKDGEIISFLNGYNLYYKINKSKSSLGDFKVVGNLNSDENLKKLYIKEFNTINNQLNSDQLKYSYQILRNLILFSQCFNKFNQDSILESESFEIGDILNDNLQSLMRYEEYKEINIEINNNNWLVCEKSNFGFFAINLETFKLFHFLNNGNVSHFVNDIDNRWSIEDGQNNMRSEVLEELLFFNKNYINKSNIDKDDKSTFYYKQYIDKNSYFNGLKLISKSNINITEKEIISNKLIRNAKLYGYNYNNDLEGHDRVLFSEIEKEYSKLLNENFNSNTYSEFDDNKDFEYPYYGDEYYYDRYLYDHFKENLFHIEKIIQNKDENISIRKIFNTKKESEEKDFIFNKKIEFINKALSIKINKYDWKFLTKESCEKYKQAIINFLNKRDKELFEKNKTTIIENFDDIINKKLLNVQELV